jgi:hypothetical protein
MSKLLNKRLIRQMALDESARNRHHVFSQVAPSFYGRLEAVLRTAIREIVASQPSKGKTIR